MKVLSIRGENLASFAGAFELLLDREPLAAAGVFALTGPVGAGKSTVLDAMALALFGRVPRLEGGGKGVKIQGNGESAAAALGSKDPATLLRRGTTRGFAEVEFKGGDGNRYRARWSVHRARNRPAGKVQSPVHQLFAVEGETPDEHREMTGAHNRETAAQIESCLGLDFDQFRRSVLLAQGEFAAFLKAKSDDRAQLLARVTGTEIYQRLGRMAFDRSREASRELEDFESRLASLSVLDAEERGVLDRKLVLRTEALDDAHRANADLRYAQTWHQQAAQLRSLTDEVHTEWLTKREAARACAENRAFLAEYERCAIGREKTVAVQQARARLADAESGAQAAAVTAKLRETTAAELRDGWQLRSARFIAHATRARDDARAAMVAADDEFEGMQRVLRERQQFRDGAPSVAEQLALRRTHDAMVETLRDALRAHDEWTQCHQEASDLAARMSRLDVLLPSVQTKVDKVTREFAAKESACEEAAHALRAVERALDLEAHRDGLEPGSPCPVCGSEEHPYAESSAVNALHEHARQRLAGLQRERTAIDAIRVALLGRHARIASETASHRKGAGDGEASVRGCRKPVAHRDGVRASVPGRDPRAGNASRRTGCYAIMGRAVDFAGGTAHRVSCARTDSRRCDASRVGCDRARGNSNSRGEALACEKHRGGSVCYGRVCSSDSHGTASAVCGGGTA